MFERILAAVDDSARSEQVMRVSRALAKDMHGALVVLRVRSDTPDHDSVTEYDLALAEQTIALRASGIAAHYLVHNGSAEQQILETAQGQRSTLIIIAAREVGPRLAPHRRMTARLAAHAHAPLLVVPERAAETRPVAFVGTPADESEVALFGPAGAPILVALDGSLMAEQALPYAAELAHWLKRPLTLLHVASPLSSQDELAQAWFYVESARRRIRERISRDLAIDVQVVSGAPITELLWAIEGRQAGAIALTAHGKVPAERASAITRELTSKLRIPALIIPAPVLAMNAVMQWTPSR